MSWTANRKKVVSDAALETMNVKRRLIPSGVLISLIAEAGRLQDMKDLGHEGWRIGMLQNFKVEEFAPAGGGFTLQLLTVLAACRHLSSNLGLGCGSISKTVDPVGVG